MCVLGHYVVLQLHASCSSSCCDTEYNVLITLVHTHTKKKKIALVMRGSTRDLGLLWLSLT
jgi:hypothetical protein